jgi:hypothetical protein
VNRVTVSRVRVNPATFVTITESVTINVVTITESRLYYSTRFESLEDIDLSRILVLYIL